MGGYRKTTVRLVPLYCHHGTKRNVESQINWHTVICMFKYISIYKYIYMHLDQIYKLLSVFPPDRFTSITVFSFALGDERKDLTNYTFGPDYFRETSPKGNLMVFGKKKEVKNTEQTAVRAWADAAPPTQTLCSLSLSLWFTHSSENNMMGRISQRN